MLPCDNGKFSPNFNILKTGSIKDYSVTGSLSGSATDRFATDMGWLDLTLISLTNMMSTGSIF